MSMLDFGLSMWGVPQATIDQLEKDDPIFARLKADLKQAEPIIVKMLPLIHQFMPILQKSWPDIVAVSPVIQQLIQFAADKE